MAFEQSASGEHPHGFHVSDSVRGVLVVVLSAAGLVGLAYGAMLLLTSPDGWVMKAASQAMATAQQGTLASYSLADAQ
jgi:hypothetical protein